MAVLIRNSPLKELIGGPGMVYFIKIGAVPPGRFRFPTLLRFIRKQSRKGFQCIRFINQYGRIRIVFTLGIRAIPGDLNTDLDVAYLTRNAFCESTTTADEILKAADLLINANHEPIIISSHRKNYCEYDTAKKESNFKRLDDLLTAFDKMQAIYLTSSELGDLYRQGWSLRSNGENVIFHKCSDDAIDVPPEFASLPIGSHLL